MKKVIINQILRVARQSNAAVEWSLMNNEMQWTMLSLYFYYWDLCKITAPGQERWQ